MTNWIGKGVPKLDAPSKAAGEARYVQDYDLPGMLHAKILRTDRVHARVKSIDTSAAESLPGVRVVITAADIENVPFGHGRDNTPLKGDTVTCIRDEIAAVAADTEEIAADAVSRIRVEYEDLPEIFTVAEALADGAPVMFPDCPDNIRFRYDYKHGDLQAGIDAADVIVEDTFDLHFVTHCCMGVSGIIADFSVSGDLTLISQTQVPFSYRRDMGAIVGVAPERIRVIQPVIGGGFGSKLDIYPYEPICVWLARKTNRPVRLVFTRSEEFIASPTRQPTEFYLRTGAKKDGTLTFREARMLHDNGGRTSWGATTPFVIMQTISSLYRVPHVSYETLVVYTNNPYSGSFRGYGNPQATFGVEQHMDMVADELGMDPVAFRLKNAQEPGETTGQGMVLVTCGLAECLEKSAQLSGYSEQRRANADQPADAKVRRGIGMASMVHVGGGAKIYRSDGCGTIIKLDDFGVATVLTGSSEIGQGSETVIAQIVATELGLDIGDVRVVNNDTQVTPWDVGVHASRTTFVAGNSARGAAIKAREKILAEAATRLETGDRDLALTDGAIVDVGSGEVVSPLAKFIRSLHFSTKNDIIITNHYYEPDSVKQDREFKGNVSSTYAFGTHVAEVEVDTETGLVRVTRLVAVHDVGKVINPLLIEGQVHGGIAIGLGYCLSEDLEIEAGKVRNPNFANYHIMTAPEMPEIVTHYVETNDPKGPYGAKGIGEAPAICVAPAVANAIHNATGKRLTALPFTPEKVLFALTAPVGD